MSPGRSCRSAALLIVSQLHVHDTVAGRAHGHRGRAGGDGAPGAGPADQRGLRGGRDRAGPAPGPGPAAARGGGPGPGGRRVPGQDRHPDRRGHRLRPPHPPRRSGTGRRRRWARSPTRKPATRRWPPSGRPSRRRGGRAEADVPFSSARKWSAASFAGHGTWVLGAPEMVLPPGPRDYLAQAAGAGRGRRSGSWCWPAPGSRWTVSRSRPTAGRGVRRARRARCGPTPRRRSPTSRRRAWP